MKKDLLSLALILALLILLLTISVDTIKLKKIQKEQTIVHYQDSIKWNKLINKN